VIAPGKNRGELLSTDQAIGFAPLFKDLTRKLSATNFTPEMIQSWKRTAQNHHSGWQRPTTR
jgi:hypothetical protein